MSSSADSACTFCGRENDTSSRFCIDCGKPMTSSAARSIPSFPASGTNPLATAPVIPGSTYGAIATPTRVSAARTISCPHCSKTVDAALPFCGYCGTRIGERVSKQDGGGLGSLILAGKKVERGPRLSVLDDHGAPLATYSLDRGEAVVGRADADIRFEDVYLSPLHARFELRQGELWVRDLGSRNGTWCFVEAPARLADGDVILLGSQLLRFRRLGYPGPHPPEADATRRMGSLVPSADVAILEQLRADGSVRDTFHLSPARTVFLGRESGDWIFPYDQTMSGRHAEIRSQDAEFYVHDSDSRNGVALAVRGEHVLKVGQRILVGDQILRIESV